MLDEVWQCGNTDISGFLLAHILSIFVFGKNSEDTSQLTYILALFDSVVQGSGQTDSGLVVC